jgi:hypothetical protein
VDADDIVTTESKERREKQVNAKSGGRYSFVSPGRQAAGRRLQEQGLAGIGGRRPTHGQRALAELFRRGLDEGSPIAQLRREATDAYVTDEGGEESVATKKKNIIRRMVRLDLNLALLDAQLDKASSLPWKKQLELFAAIDRNAATYNACVKTLGGPEKRQKDVDNQIVVRRWADPAPISSNGEQGGGQ